jgi:Tol biopolymer transport system component
MRRIGALSFGLIAILAGCSPAGGSATAVPTTASAASATSSPTDEPVQTPAPTVVPTAPAGLSGRLLFTRFEEATHTATGMFASGADGSGEVAVPMPWTEGGGRWSTSGEFIAIPTQLDDGRVGTAILDATGKILRVLEIADEGLNLACTTWSPDDARLACEGWDDSDAARAGIYAVRSSDGGDIQRLTTPPAGKADDDGDWSSDGTIVFKRYGGEEAPGPLFLVDAAGGEPRPFTSGGQEDPGRFSPDGTLVATSSGGVIEVFDLTGARVSTIEQPADFLFGPAWSPDGAWLVFSSTPDGQFLSDLFIARPDGADMYQVTRTSANEITVDWGPDTG